MKAELLYIQKLTYDENTGNEIIGLFPSEYNPAIVSSYTYDAKRMGGAPTITATIYSSDPLQWKKEEFVEYNGDRFFASYTPNSTKDNSSRMWKSEITFTSRRELLDNTLFFDVVVDDVDTQNKDRYRSNQTKFTFGGTIYEFVARINSSMEYCELYHPTDEYKGYYVVVDEGYGTDEVKEVSFENQYLTDVLQLINTTFELNYYWDGNVCHVGKVQHDLTDTPIKYGSSDALISVSKENANYKIVDMITGYGSSDNLPYYYPNDDEFGEAVFNTENFSKSLVSSISLGDVLKWNSDVYNNTLILCKNSNDSYTANVFGTSSYLITNFGGEYYKGKGEESKNVIPTCSMGEKYTEHNFSSVSRLIGSATIWTLFEFNSSAKEDTVKMDGLSFVAKESDSSLKFGLEFSYEYAYYVGENTNIDTAYKSIQSVRGGGSISGEVGGSFGNGNSDVSISKRWAFGDNIDGLSNYTKSSKKEHTFERNSTSTIVIACKITATNIEKASGTRRMNTVSTSISGSIELTRKPSSVYYFETSDGHTQSYDESGININGIGDIPHKDLTFSFDGTYWNATEGGENNAAKITITDRVWLAPSSVLMPSIYRNTKGAERFYYALNNIHKLPSGSGYYEFVNLYKKGNPHQGAVTFDDIKPTINGIVNAEGQLFGEIADVAFDSNDSDVKDSDGKYIHNYFYIKLHKFNGEFGFDLFNHVLAKEPAKINLIKSNGCPACSFVIHNQPSADNSKCYNCVSVDENGNLKQVSTDKNDYIFANASDAYEDKLNQDSTQKELWIAVQKDTSTLGIVMPNASAGFKPQKGDLFVITGIKPPKVLVTAAEKRLDDALIKHMSENNTDQFNYSVKFSRIFLQENPDFASKLNENAKLSIQVQGDSDSDGNLISHEVFVSNYSVKVDNDELAEVEVELVNSLEVTKSDTKQIIDAVKGETVKSLSIMVGGSNTNSFNASITDKMYLSKLKDDIANGKITFIKGLIAKGLADLMMGAKFGNSAMITELGDAFFRAIKSLDYDNAAEQGFSVEKEKNGKYHAFFTNLTIWGKAIFHELEVRKLSYSGGNIYLSGAGSKLIKVVPVKKLVSADGVTSWVETTENDVERFGWKCYLLADDGTTATMNDWQEGDQARCQTMGEIATGGAYSDVSNKSYWRTIPKGGVSTQNEKIYGTKNETYIDEDGNEQTRVVQVELYDGQAFAWIVIGKHSENFDGYTEDSAPDETKDIPAEGDTIVLDGNRHRNEHGEYDKTDRQNVIILETTGEYAPRIACYANITEYKHTITKSVNGSDKEVSLSVFETSPKGGTKINSSRFEWISDDGSTINIINYRGDWVSDNTYHKNDQVNHNNAVWVCVANSGVDVTEDPHDGATYWKKVLSGGKGEKGDKGDKGDKGEDGLSGNGIVPAYIRSKDNPTPPTSTDKNNLDNGWSLTISSVADVKNVSYSDSSWTDYNDGSYTWKKSPTTANNSTSWCLVTFTTTQAKQVVKFVIKSFSEPRYDYIFLSEIDAASVPSRPTSNGWYRAVSGNGVELSITDIVATAGTHTVYVCYGKDNSGDYNGDYGLFRIEKMTDMPLLPLWQSNGKEVFTREDSGAIKSKIESWSEPFKVTGEDGADGKDGTDGEQGESALEIIVTPETLVFDTNDYGLVPTETSKQASISCYRNGVKVTNVSYSKSAENNCSASVSESNSSATVTISRITSQEVADDSGNSSTISNTSGYATIQVWDKDTNLYHRVQVKFMVNVAKFTGQMVNTNKRFSLQHQQLSNAVNDKVGSSELKQFKAEITQTAREISLSVSEKSVGRRNMLIGSACRKYGDGFMYMSGGYYDGYPLDQIEKNSGIDGVNCIHCRTKQTGTDSYYLSGFRWNGNSPQGNIKLQKGKNYVLSFYAKTHTPNDIVFLAEVLYQGSKIDTSRPAGYDGPTGFSTTFSASEADKWELFTVKVSVPSDAPYEYVEINIFARARSYSFVGGYICKPMLEEGENYNGWTLSEQDYDYIGGNMLDNTLSLDKSGSLYDVNGTLTPSGFGESTSIYKSFVYKLKGTVDNFNQLPSSGNVYDDTYYVRNDGTCYAYNGSEFIDVGNDSYYNILEWRKGKPGAFTPFGLEANKDYVFSFMAKGTGLLTAYFYNPDTGVFVESSLGATNISVNGNANFQLTNKWERYWVHWRPSDSLHKYVLLRLNRSFQSDGSAPITDCYIAQPKLEEGARVTEYTERKSDLVDKASLKAAGILVDAESVTLYGSQVHIKKNKTDADDTVLIDNKTGKVSAGLINADEVVAKGIKTQELEAQHLNVTGNSRLGIFEIHTAAEDDRDEYTVNGDSIKYSGSYMFPDGKTEASGAGSFLTYKPMFIRQGAPDGYEYMRLGHQFTEWDDGNISGGSKNYFFVGAAARYVCSGDVFSCTRNVLPVTLKYNSDIKPAAYVYSVLAKDSAAFAIYTQAVGTAGERLAIQTNGAIRCVEALNIETIYRSQQISSGIGAARCVNTSEITIRLPINPVVGQKFYVLQEDTGKVNITGDSNHQIILFNKSIVTTCNSNTKGQISIFIWSGNYWFGSFLTGIL